MQLASIRNQFSASKLNQQTQTLVASKFNHTLITTSPGERPVASQRRSMVSSTAYGPSSPTYTSRRTELQSGGLACHEPSYS